MINPWGRGIKKDWAYPIPMNSFARNDYHEYAPVHPSQKPVRKPFFSNTSLIGRILESRRAAKQAQRDEFFAENRVEVRNLYRDLLKLTAKSIPRKMEREARLAEMRHFFRIH